MSVFYFFIYYCIALLLLLLFHFLSICNALFVNPIDVVTPLTFYSQ